MKTQHEVLMEDPEFRKLLAVEGLAAEASEVIARLMAERGMSKADLARRLGKSRAWVTQLLSGQTNMTVRTLAEAVFALEGEVKLQLHNAAKKAADRPLVAEWHFATYTMTVMRPETAAEAVFELKAPVTTGRSDEVVRDSGSNDPARSEYAA